MLCFCGFGFWCCSCSVVLPLGVLSFAACLVVVVCFFLFCFGPLCFSSLILSTSVLVPPEDKIKLEKYRGPNQQKQTKRQHTRKRKQTTKNKKEHKKETRTDPNKQGPEKHKFQRSNKFHKNWIFRNRVPPLILTRRVTQSISQWGGTDDPIFKK